MGVALKAILTASDKATPVLRGALAASDDLTKKSFKGLEQLDKLQSKISGGIKTTIASLGAAGLAMGVVGGKVIMTGADFEEAMSGVSAVSGATSEQFEKLKKRALELGSTTKYSSTQVAGAMEIMAKAGLNVEQVMQGLPGILSAAAADGATIEDTATSLMASMKSLGLGPERMGLFADQLAKAGDSTAASIGSISESMAVFGPVVKQLGIPVESAIAQIALLQDAGIDASSAGTTLAATYSKLASPTKRTADELRKLGVEVKDAHGNMKLPDKLLAEILKGTNKIKGNVGKMAAFTQLVGLESQKALMNVADAAESGRLEEVTNSLKDAAGYADKLAAKRLDNLKGDLGLLQASADGVAQALFNLQGGAMRGVVQETKRWVDVNKEWISLGIDAKIREWTPLVVGFADGVAVSFQKVGPIIDSVGRTLGYFSGDAALGAQSQAYFLGRNLTDAGLAFVGFTAATKLATLATWGFSVGTKIARVAVFAYEVVIKGLRWTVLAYETSIKTARATTLAFALAADAGVISGNAWSVSMVRMRLASLTAAGGMQALAVTAGVAVAAIGAVMLAVDQANKFLNENGGWEGAGGFFGIGTDDWGFEGVDQAMNRQAKERRGQADEEAKGKAGQAGDELARGATNTGLNAFEAAGIENGMTPDQLGMLNRQLGLLNPAGMPGMAAPPVGPAVAVPAAAKPEKQLIELTVKTPKDTTAEVTKRPSGAKVNLRPSGAD